MKKSSDTPSDKKNTQKRVEITRWKVGNDVDAFQAVDSVEDYEEPEIAECNNIKEEEHDGGQK